jgi:3-hydroxybutyryl-CoA dehydrogenase
MHVGIVGAGTMGRGIAQVCAAIGHDVRLTDIAASQVNDAVASIGRRLDRLVEKGAIQDQDARESLARIGTTTDIPSAVSGVDVVIESAVESLDVKHAIMADVADHAPVDCILGTNSSQLPITSIAAAVPAHAHRVVGLHFFNPAPVMRLVEIVAGLSTSEETISKSVAFAQSLGKETVVCRKDSPGFLTSRVSAIVRLECLRMLEEGVASAADIDKAVRLGLNYPMGPLELGDMNGLDTYLHILESLENTLGERFRPTVTLRNLVSAGRHGRKTGLGIYRYDEQGVKQEADL